MDESDNTWPNTGANDDRNAVPPETHQRHRNMPKVCLVCEDRAYGANFGATTCESCKAFFRRHASKNFSTKCDGKCAVNFQTRAQCRSCRLQKCYNVGMRQEKILTEEQKQQRLMKIKDNRDKRQQSLNPTFNRDDSPTSSLPFNDTPNLCLPPPGQVPQNSSNSNLTTLDCQVLANEFHCKNNVGDFKANSYNSDKSEGSQSACNETSPVEFSPKCSDEDSGKAESTRSSSASADEHVICPLIKPDFSHDLFCKMPIGDINQLLHVFRAFDISWNIPIAEVEIPTNFTKLFNMAHMTIRKLVKMAKNIETFKGLTQTDQVNLLKNWIMDIMVIKSMKNYDKENDTWVVPMQSGGTQTLPTHLLKQCSPGTASFWSCYLKVADMIVDFTRGDDMVLMLMILITLFSTPSSPLIDHKKVYEGWMKHRTLLQSYWVAKYTEPCADLLPRLDRLLLCIRRDLGDASELILATNVDDLEPLILEMFSIAP